MVLFDFILVPIWDVAVCIVAWRRKKMEKSADLINKQQKSAFICCSVETFCSYTDTHTHRTSHTGKIVTLHLQVKLWRVHPDSTVIYRPLESHLTYTDAATLHNSSTQASIQGQRSNMTWSLTGQQGVFETKTWESHLFKLMWQISYLHIQKTQIIIHLKLCLCHMMSVSLTITPFWLCFWSPPTQILKSLASKYFTIFSLQTALLLFLFHYLLGSRYMFGST